MPAHSKLLIEPYPYPITRFVLWYVSNLHDKPVITKSITSAITALLGSFVSQLRTRGNISNIHWPSVFSITLFGLSITGPLSHYFYVLLDRLIPPSKNRVTFLKRLLADRLLFGPFILYLFFIFTTLFEGKSLETARKKIDQNYWNTFTTSIKVWTPVQFINVNYVPPMFRVLVANIVSAFWTMYLASVRSSKSVKSKKKRPEV